MNKQKNVCWDDHNPRHYLYIYYNSDASSHHLLYDKLFSHRLEGKKKNGDFSSKQFLHFQPSCCCLNAHSCVQISVWCLNVKTRRTSGRYTAQEPDRLVKYLLKFSLSSIWKKTTPKHWRVTQRADTVESYRKESRESLFLATAKKRKLIA